ncbi:MAG: PH domain-containing protein [Muribaculaceae bacterium]|nr:PH domain-containing protein [Muribaculaceae bacterium]
MNNTILKKRVDISTWSTILTIVTIAALIGMCILEFYKNENVVICCLPLVFLAIWSFFNLFYCPMYLRLTDKSLNVETSIRTKSFALSEIEEVKICPPTMSEKRICGSGGFFGYWGWFSEPSIGKYFAYYGMASQTFLIRLRSGRQYMLGCRDAAEMAKELEKLLQRNE